MDYAEKIKRMDEHLETHPHDYQTVISRMKVASKYIDEQRRQKTISRLRNVAKYRRMLNSGHDTE